MQDVTSVDQEAKQDIFFGQQVLIWARWAIILAGASVVLWTAGTVGQLTLNMLMVVAFMAVNFFMHGRYMMEKPANRQLLLLSSAVDLAIIAVMVLAFSDKRGLESPFFVMYYPVVAAFAFVFPPRATIIYAAVVVAVYAATTLVADPSTLGDVNHLKTLTMRLITLAAMGGLGTYYWRIQRDRRRAAGASGGLLGGLSRSSAPAAGGE
jgi:hypothetical protein